MPVAKPNPFLEFLNRAVSAVFLLAALIFGVWLLIQGIKRLAAYLCRFTLDEDEAVFLKPESLQEKTEHGRKPFAEELRHLLDRSPKRRIRRIYQRCIRQKIFRKGVAGEFSSLSVLTPAQLEEKAGLETGAGAGKKEQRFHELYEKARYGKGGCSREEEEEMKACARAVE